MHVHLHAGDDLVALVLKDEARMNGDVPGVTPAVIVQEFSEVLHVNLEVQVLQQLKDNHAAGIEGILLRVVEGGLQVCPQGEPPEPEGAAKVDDVAGVVAVVPLNDGIAQDFPPVTVAVDRTDGIAVVGVAGAEVEVLHSGEVGENAEGLRIHFVVGTDVEEIQIHVGTKIHLHRKIPVVHLQMRDVHTGSHRPPHKGGTKIFPAVPAVGGKLVEHVHKGTRQHHVEVVTKDKLRSLAGPEPHVGLDGTPHQRVVLVLEIVGQIQPILSLGCKPRHTDEAKGDVVQTTESAGVLSTLLAVVLNLVDAVSTEFIVHLVGLGKTSAASNQAKANKQFEHLIHRSLPNKSLPKR